MQQDRIQATLLLAIAIACGGGGSGVGLANLAVQLAAIALIALRPVALLTFFRRAPRPIAILTGLSLALPLLQSIPLPPPLWQALPGRTLIADSLNLIGQHDAWFPFSLEVHRTLLAFFALLPPVLLLALTWQLPETQRRTLLVALAGMALIVVLLGAQQLASGNRILMLFDEGYQSSDLQGTFANRNAAGVFFVLALCALAGAFPRHSPGLKRTLAALAAALLLLIGVVLTRSRSSMALTLVPCLLAAVRFALPRLIRAGRTTSPQLLILAGLLAALGLAGVIGLASQNQRIRHSFTRFDDLHDRRPAIWADTVTAAERYWPLGSGIGTFDEVFQIDESLETLGAGRAARAHNDYLETALESGLPGLALLAAWALVLIPMALRALRASGPSQAAAAGMAVIVLQSISDYPLRNQTLLCIAALLLAFLLRPPETPATRRRRSRPHEETPQGEPHRHPFAQPGSTPLDA